MSDKLLIGVMAIQGAVEEHMNCIKALGHDAKEIRVPEDIEGVDGIILPGGESTAMAIVGEKRGLFPALKAWVASDRPIWGTCAGMILLSNHAIKQKEGGQALLGGLDVQVCRNYFGSQVHSCELNIEINDNTVLKSSNADPASKEPFRAVFIRAPAILTAGSNVEILATLNVQPHRSALKEVEETLNSLTLDESKMEGDQKKFRIIVAVRQQNILATAFHPELTTDLRWHSSFIDMVRKSKESS